MQTDCLPVNSRNYPYLVREGLQWFSNVISKESISHSNRLRRPTITKQSQTSKQPRTKLNSRTIWLICTRIWHWLMVTRTGSRRVRTTSAKCSILKMIKMTSGSATNSEARLSSNSPSRSKDYLKMVLGCNALITSHSKSTSAETCPCWKTCCVAFSSVCSKSQIYVWCMQIWSLKTSCLLKTQNTRK